jgi:type II secretory pathway component GspD/PulD (secretin)
MRVRLTAVLAAVVLPWCAPAASANDPKPLVTRAFDVADLVVPIPDTVPDEAGLVDEKRHRAATVENADRLAKLVIAMVRPYSWDGMGGSGTLAFFEVGNALTVTNSAEVLTEVGDLLGALRRLQDVSVVTEVRVLKVPAGFCERAGVKRDGDVCLRECEVRSLLEAAQAHRDSTVHGFPKITTFDGQSATVRTGERRTFVTGGEVTRVKGQTVFVPKNKAVDLGDTLTLCGRISADRKFVKLIAQMTRTAMVGEVELVPVTITVRPKFADGNKGQPIPFTQFIQSPELETRSAEKTVVVPDGGTVVIGGWTEKTADAPGTGKIPYVNKLFKDVGASKDLEVVVLATTRVVRSEPEFEIAPAPRESRR